ncbi:MAG: hypothetical protein PUJ80_09480, partial [Verrucomicrobiota bacterium]|nr:hypothetical protein [Verrucomicrobiota bacterium]
MQEAASFVYGDCFFVFTCDMCILGAWLSTAISAGGASAEIALPARRSWPSGDSARPAVGFPWLTSSAFRPRFPGVSGHAKKPRKIFAEPLAPRGAFWYITHPLRQTGLIPAARREIFDSGGASRT